MSRDGAFSRAQQTKNWCVGFSFPPPAYAGIHPTLYLFGFQANAPNSHSPPSLPGFDPGSGGAFGVSGAGLMGLGLPGGLCCGGPPASGGLRRVRGALGGLGGPPEASWGAEPKGAAHALNHSLGLQSISKRWCE